MPLSAETANWAVAPDMTAERLAETVMFPIVSPLKAKTATVELAGSPSTIVARRGFPEKTLKVKLEMASGGGGVIAGGVIAGGVIAGGVVVVGVVGVGGVVGGMVVVGGVVVGGMVVVGGVVVVGGMVVVVDVLPVTLIAQVFSAVCWGILLSLIAIMASFIPSVEYDLVTIESEPERLSVPDQE